MSKPVYVLVLGKDFTEAWHQLPPDDQQKLFAKGFESRDQAGGKDIMTCNSRWSSPQWMLFSIEEYPSIEVQRSASCRFLLKLIDHFAFSENCGNKRPFGSGAEFTRRVDQQIHISSRRSAHDFRQEAIITIEKASIRILNDQQVEVAATVASPRPNDPKTIARKMPCF